MNRTLFKCAITMAILFSSLAYPATAASPLTVRDTMRTIERLQDAFVAGDTKAGTLSNQLMFQIETDISNSNVEQLNDPKTVYAIVVYLLSGGNPSVVEKAFKNIKIESDQNDLFKGALAYAKNDRELAATKLLGISALNLPPHIAGRLLLIQAILSTDDNLKDALKLLERASSMMPGTVVNEGALRRCTAFAIKLDELEQFKTCSSGMIRRFQNSPYLSDFESNFASYAAEFDEERGHIFSQWLIPTLEDFPRNAQVEILLLIAKTAVAKGNFVFANLCASRVGLLSDSGSVQWNRAMLYSGASVIGLNEIKLANLRLGKVIASKLDNDDQTLLKKAVNLVEQIVAEPSADPAANKIASAEDPQFQSFQKTANNAQRILELIASEGGVTKK